jgi:hypothetical protein
MDNNSKLHHNRTWLGYFVGFDNGSTYCVYEPDSNIVKRVAYATVDNAAGLDDPQPRASLNDVQPVSTNVTAPELQDESDESFEASDVEASDVEASDVEASDVEASDTEARMVDGLHLDQEFENADFPDDPFSLPTESDQYLDQELEDADFPYNLFSATTKDDQHVDDDGSHNELTSVTTIPPQRQGKNAIRTKEAHARIIYLKEIRGLTHQKIADEFGVTRSVIDSRVSQIKRDSLLILKPRNLSIHWDNTLDKKIKKLKNDRRADEEIAGEL